jgi:flagellar basal body rod protein FlgG
MNQGIYSSAAGGFLQQMRMDVLANNLANVDTPGYKPDVFMARLREAEAVEDGPRTWSNSLLDRMGGGVFAHKTTTDFRPGPIELTGNPLHMAIHGKGFFTVRGSDGQTFLTRAGDFARAADGRLVTANGRHEVLNDGGSPIVIEGSTANLRVLPDGTIVRGNVPVDRVGLRDVPENARGQLRKAGENLYRFFGQGQLTPAEGSVESGAVEGAAVNPATEMVSMIEASRRFEFNMRLLQFHDQMMESYVRVGRPA